MDILKFIFYFQEKKVEELFKDNPFKELKGGGPCVKGLDDVLKKCHVERKAYHGKSFVGNHVDRMLKVSVKLQYL